jgi:hypothetical protein
MGRITDRPIESYEKTDTALSSRPNSWALPDGRSRQSRISAVIGFNEL